MDEHRVRQILRQIQGGNCNFDLNSTEEAQILGYEPGIQQSGAEAASLRHHLDMLSRRGDIRIEFVSAANNCVAALTSQGHDLLRRLGG